MATDDFLSPTALGWLKPMEAVFGIGGLELESINEYRYVCLNALPTNSVEFQSAGHPVL
jgi:hypothetical protein